MIPHSKWTWYGKAGHFICAAWCQFHLCTKIGKYLVSTVGEYWPERSSREIHASIYDPQWLAKNKHRMGDDFDYAYMKRFGYQEIGHARLYETMVFLAGPVCRAPGCECAMPVPKSWHELYFRGYNRATDAMAGHYQTCLKWARKVSDDS